MAESEAATEECVVKLNCQADTNAGGGRRLYCFSRWPKAPKGGIEIIVLDDEGGVFSVDITADHLQQLSEKLRIEASQWAKEAFVDASDQHVFTLSKNKHETTLVWRRQDTSSRARVRVATLEARRPDDAAAARSQLLDAALDIGRRERLARLELAERHDKLLSDLRKARSLIDDFTADKLKLEENMYERFLPILQSKQDKVAELEKRLARLGGANNDMDVDSERSADDYGSGTDIDDAEEADVGSKGEKSKRTRITADKNDVSLNDSQNFLGIN